MAELVNTTVSLIDKVIDELFFCMDLLLMRLMCVQYTPTAKSACPNPNANHYPGNLVSEL